MKSSDENQDPVMEQSISKVTSGLIASMREISTALSLTENQSPECLDLKGYILTLQEEITITTKSITTKMVSIENTEQHEKIKELYLTKCSGLVNYSSWLLRKYRNQISNLHINVAMENGNHITTLGVEKDEAFEKRRLPCKCVPPHCGCLFCDPEMILRNVPKEKKKEVRERSKQDRELLNKGVSINEVQEIVFGDVWKKQLEEAEKNWKLKIEKSRASGRKKK